VKKPSTGRRLSNCCRRSKRRSKKCKDAKVGGKARLTQLDVKKCRGMRSTILNGESLQSELTMTSFPGKQ